MTECRVDGRDKDVRLKAHRYGPAGETEGRYDSRYLPYG
jgi:hypothetical protein